MSKVIDKKELLRLNPHIDRRKLEESILLAQKLSDIGVKTTDYKLASPFSRRRINRQRGKFRLHNDHW